MHDVDPSKSEAKGLSTKEKIVILAVIILLGLMGTLYQSYHSMKIELNSRNRSAGGVGGSGSAPPKAPAGGLGTQISENPLIDISGIHGRLYSDGYFRYNGTVGNIGNDTASNLILSVEIFDSRNSKLVGRDTQLYPALPPSANRTVHGTLAVPSETRKVRMEVDVENFPIVGKDDAKDTTGEKATAQ